MRALEKIVGGSSVNFGSFNELVDHVGTQIKEDKKPLIAIELPKWSKFIAFFVRELRDNGNGTYRPSPSGYLYDCNLPDGFFTPHGEGSLQIPNYPVDIGKQDFEQGIVYVIEPNTNLWQYIKIFTEPGGKIKAHEFWRQTHPDIIPT